MSSYIFELSDYHAVKEAEILLDGITVLSGLNGSGKSTVARWLHHVVKVLNDYDKLAEEEAVGKFMSFLYSIGRAVRAIYAHGSQNDFVDMYEDAVRHGANSWGDTEVYFEKALHVLEEALDANLTDDADLDSMRRFDHVFSVDSGKVSSVEEYKGLVLDRLRAKYLDIHEKMTKNMSSRSIQEFADKLFAFADSDVDGDVDVLNISFREDGTELILGDTFGMPLNMRNVIYIDTQKIGQAFNRMSSSALSDMLQDKRNDISPEARAIAMRIMALVGGDVQVERKYKGVLGRRCTYNFIGKDGQSFNLKGAATGIISFSYILQLIKNGWIDDGTLLIIDEPECHLHPQWIVDYARMLVLIHKNMGAKILISSHNPDMVSAIQAIARKECVLDMTNFYLSEKVSEEDGKYVFTHLGSEIDKIFDSFNIAIDRIAAFGEEAED